MDNEELQKACKEHEETIKKLKDKNLGLDNQYFAQKGRIDRLEKENEALTGQVQALKFSLERVSEILTRELGRT